MANRWFRNTSLAALAILSQMIGTICVAQNASRFENDPHLLAARKMIGKDDLQGLQSLEPGVLNSMGSGAQRKGPELILRIGSGAQKIYNNRPECEISTQEAKCQKYVLIAHLNSLNMFILAKLYYESAEYLLVDDRTGIETILRSFPHWSPSGNQVLLFLVNDDRYGFGIQIWRREGGKFVLEWSGSPYTDGIYTSYELIRWNVENTIEVQADVSFEPPKHDVIKRFTLIDSTRGWNLTGIQ